MEPVDPIDPVSAATRGTEQLVRPQAGKIHKFFYVDTRLPVDRRMEQGMFGWIDGDEVKVRPASPAECMARIAWFNRLYPQAAISLEGIDENGRIHTSQPYIDGRLPVSFNDIVRTMEIEGWEPYFVDARDQSTSTFYHPEAGAYLTDVHEGNGKIITTEDGRRRFQPFDVVPILPFHTA